MTTELPKLERYNDALLVIYDGISAGWDSWVRLSSDWHHDNILCDRQLLHKHLDKTLERNAIDLVFGDIFCAMQGKYDPRSSMDELRPEDKDAKYLDKIVEHAATDLAPYAKHIGLMAHGNHETNIIKRHGTDLISSVVALLNNDYGGSCKVGKFGGWVRFIFKIHKTKRFSRDLRYMHGAGAGAPVTKGTIQTNRQAASLDNPDFVVNGHNHEGYHFLVTRSGLSRSCKVENRTMHFIRTPGYKCDYDKGETGYIVEKGGGPTPKGCAWLHFYLSNAKKGLIDAEVVLDVV